MVRPDDVKKEYSYNRGKMKRDLGIKNTTAVVHKSLTKLICGDCNTVEAYCKASSMYSFQIAISHFWSSTVHVRLHLDEGA